MEFFDGQKWVNGETLTVTNNGTYQYRITDSSGNVTIHNVSVDKIDKIAPNKPIITANITSPTTQKVVVTATFSNDSVINEYSFDNETWTTYVRSISCSENKIIYFRSFDEANNVSDIAIYTVDYIDKIAPEAPTVCEFKTIFNSAMSGRT